MIVNAITVEGKLDSEDSPRKVIVRITVGGGRMTSTQNGQGLESW